MNAWAIASANRAITENVVSTMHAPIPVTKPALCPLLKVFWITRIAIGPIGADAQIPIMKPFRMSGNIYCRQLSV